MKAWNGSWKPMRSEFLGAIGLCRKAGKVIVGTDAVCEALRGKNKPCAVFAAKGAKTASQAAKARQDGECCPTPPPSSR